MLTENLFLFCPEESGSWFPWLWQRICRQNLSLTQAKRPVVKQDTATIEIFIRSKTTAKFRTSYSVRRNISSGIIHYLWNETVSIEAKFDCNNEILKNTPCISLMNIKIILKFMLYSSKFLRANFSDNA